MHADLFLTVCKNAKFSNGGGWQVTDHPVQKALFYRLTGLLCKLQNVGYHGANGDLTSRLEEIVDRGGGDADTIRDFKQSRVSSNQQGAATSALGVLS